MTQRGLPVPPALGQPIDSPVPPLPPGPPDSSMAPGKWQTSQPKIDAPAPGENSGEMISLEYPNADVRAILEVWERLTGKKALFDNTVQGPCGINAKEVPKQEAIRIIETALLLNGFTLVPGPGSNIVRVLGASKNPRQFGPPLYTDVAALPENDMVVSFLFRLEFADPAEVQGVIAQYVAPSPYTSVLALTKAQSLIVTENTSVIRSIAQVISQMDRKPAEVVSEFIPLERADAKEIIEKLNTIFEKQPTGPGGATPGAPAAAVPAPAAAAVPAPQPAEGQPAGAEATGPSVTLSEDSLIVGKIKLTADIRTNRIHVVTRPVNIPFIRRLIKEFDSDIPFGQPTSRALRFVAAGDVLDIVVKAITEPGAKEEGGGGSTAKPAAPISNPSSYGGSGMGGSSGSGGYGRSGGGSNLGGEDLTTSPVDTIPEARTVGSTKIIADKRANAIIVLGNKEVKNKIFKILDEIDVRAPQVMLTCVIGELDLTDSKEFGVSWFLKSKGLTSSTSSSTSGTTTTTTDDSSTGIAGLANNLGLSGSSLNLSSLTSAGALASAFSGSGLGINGLISVTKTLEAAVHALESTGRFRVTSRPMVFTSNNKKALIASGKQVAVPASTQSGYGYGTTSSSGLYSTSNIEYKDVFLKLEVQPLINSDREVTLDIVQEVNDIAGDTSSTTTTTSGINAPTINSRRIKTTVSVANNATVVLGGLVQEEKRDSRTGIPVISKIPYIGNLFSTKTRSVKRSELVVLIRPTVTQSPCDAVRAGENAQEKLNFPPDLDATLDPQGTREKLDRGSRHLLHPPKAILRTE